MKVNILESNSPPLREGVRIRQISEDQAKLLFECEDSSTFDVTLTNPVSRWQFAIKPIKLNI